MILSAGMPVMPLALPRMSERPCELTYRSYLSDAASYAARQALGSIGLPTMRLLSRVMRVTCAACAKAESVPASSPYS